MKIVILGGGAAGFMAAVTAAETHPENEVILLEKSLKTLQKVRISGGGRCNVTHRPHNAKNFSQNYPRGGTFLRKLFSVFNANDTVSWFESRGIQLKTEADGRMFPITDSSETVAFCLFEAARNAGVKIITQTGIRSFSHNAEAGFILETLSGDTIDADRLLIASGGHPQSQGYDWLRKHNIKIQEPVPSLFTFNCPDSPVLHLSGIAIPSVSIKISGTSFATQGPLLFTHWGFSGPAVLKLSAFAARHLADSHYHFKIRINWIPEQNPEKVREFLIAEKNNTPKQQIASHAKFGLPLNVWKAWVKLSEIDEHQKWSDISHKALNKLTEVLTNSEFTIQGKTTFKEEFVTCGGVSLDEVNPASLESKRLPGLYFAGEILDIDGITGGFNFQNAWTTGYVAGYHIAQPKI